MEERYSDYKLETAKNGDIIPVLGGIYLHSQYDPRKEAEQLLEKYEDKIQHNTNFLIFGLGYGYHVESLLAKIGNQKFKITVLETEQVVIDSFIQAFPETCEKIEIIRLENPKDIYSKLDFIKFLMKKPVIIKHEASFMLHKEKYIKLLGFKAGKKSSQYKNFLLNPAGTELYLNDELSLVETVNQIKKSRKIDSRAKYLSLALDEVVKREVRGTNS